MEASRAPWQQCINKGILPLLDKNLVFFPQIHDLSITMKKKKHWTNPNWVTFYKMPDQYSPKLSGSWKTRKYWNCHRPKETEMWQQMQFGSLDWILEPEDTNRKTGDIQIKNLEFS